MQYVPQNITAGTVTLRVGIVEITMFATTSQVTVPTVVSLIGRGSGVTVRTRILCNALLWSRQVKWSCYITLKSKNSNVTCYKPFDSNMKTYRSLFSCRYHQFSGGFFLSWFNRYNISNNSVAHWNFKIDLMNNLVAF